MVLYEVKTLMFWQPWGKIYPLFQKQLLKLPFSTHRAQHISTTGRWCKLKISYRPSWKGRNGTEMPKLGNSFRCGRTQLRPTQQHFRCSEPSVRLRCLDDQRAGWVSWIKRRKCCPESDTRTRFVCFELYFLLSVADSRLDGNTVMVWWCGLLS